MIRLIFLLTLSMNFSFAGGVHLSDGLEGFVKQSKADGTVLSSRFSYRWLTNKKKYSCSHYLDRLSLNNVTQGERFKVIDMFDDVTKDSNNSWETLSDRIEAQDVPDELAPVAEVTFTWKSPLLLNFENLLKEESRKLFILFQFVDDYVGVGYFTANSKFSFENDKVMITVPVNYSDICYNSELNLVVNKTCDTNERLTVCDAKSSIVLRSSLAPLRSVLQKRKKSRTLVDDLKRGSDE